MTQLVTTDSFAEFTVAVANAQVRGATVRIVTGGEKKYVAEIVEPEDVVE